jgi:hypothetical protein
VYPKARHDRRKNENENEKRKTKSDKREAHFASLLIFIHANPYTTKRDLGAGRTQVARSGQRGMDAALAAPGHGWPMAACPRSVAEVREPDEVGPSREQKRFGYFRAFRK